MEKNIEVRLLNILCDLEKKELKHFRFTLRSHPLKKGYQAIQRGQLENADPTKLTNLLISYYGESYAVEVTVEVLTNINKRDLAETLRHDSSIQEHKSEIHHVPEATHLELSQERTKATQQVLEKLNLVKHESKKLRLTDIQKIGPESLTNQPSQMLDLLGSLIRKVVSWNGEARHTSLVPGAYTNHRIEGDEERAKKKEEDIDCKSLYVTKAKTIDSLHPLDVLCAVLLCSDSFLQQEILSRMSMCQFALPLLLPPLNSPRCTLLLWAMRDIVRRWRPHSLAQSRGFREESLVLTRMPTVSFVRLGSCSFSKSQLLNEVLSPAQQHHDFFVHRDMQSGNVQREIADGLVEIAWYFPARRENSDLFPEPVAVTNLRGDIESHWLQFRFLTQVSSAVFIFTESIGEREYALLSSLQGSATQYYFILSAQSEKHKEVCDQLARLARVLKLSNAHLLTYSTVLHKTKHVEMVQNVIGTVMNSTTKLESMESIAAHAQTLGIQVDEDCEECLCAKKHAESIVAEIKDPVKYKEEIMRLHQRPWKMAGVEKEQHRIGQRGDSSTGGEKTLELYAPHTQYDLPLGVVKFIQGIENISSQEVAYFLKWLAFYLDGLARGKTICLTEADHSERGRMLQVSPRKLSELKMRIPDSSLGVEHFMHAIAHFYEAQSTQVKEGKMLKSLRKYTYIPRIHAGLMLEGLLTQLINGDAANIPLQWVTDVLTELHAKLGGRSRMLVLSVLGGQGTGKSTLLNTVFGLQFAVSSGRRTRGAFMSLIRVAKTFQQDLGCDFLLVIDTEGLKAPELSTQVVGLSDIMVVHMENAPQMLGVLRSGGLQLEEIRHKSNCQFVHQNISDVSAHEQDMWDRGCLLQPLDETSNASIIAHNNRKCHVPGLIFFYEPDKHNQYVHVLWHRIPPMASVKKRFSINACEPEKYLFEFIKNQSPHNKDIPQFLERLSYLQNTGISEHLGVRPKDNLIDKAYAYNQIHVYSSLECNFNEEMDSSVSEKITFIKSQTPSELEVGKLNCEMQDKLICGKEKILGNQNKYFESRVKNLHLTETFGEEYIRTTTRTSKIKELLCMKKIHFIQFLSTLGGKKCKLNKADYEEISDESLILFAEKMAICLREDQYRLKIPTFKNVLRYKIKPFRIKRKYFELHTKQYYHKAEELVKILIDNCKKYTAEKVKFRADYDNTYCRELLLMINEWLQQDDVQELHTNIYFAIDLKFYILSTTSYEFLNTY